MYFFYWRIYSLLHSFIHLLIQQILKRLVILISNHGILVAHIILVAESEDAFGKCDQGGVALRAGRWLAYI